MKRTANPKIGGVLAIISGVLGLLGTASYSIGWGDVGSGFSKGGSSTRGKEYAIQS